ncbi:voltage-dependent anion channel [Aspergillus crustosus]
MLGLSLGIYLLQIFLYLKHVLHEIRWNIVEASCLSSIPIAFTCIIQMVALQYGRSADLVAYVLWWISTALLIISVVGVPHLQLRMQPTGIEHIPPLFLLPAISIITSAAAGGILCGNSQLSAHLRVPMVIVSYMELGAGIPLAICVDACILYHHHDGEYPQYDKAYQDMVLCGLFGQASFAL